MPTDCIALAAETSTGVLSKLTIQRKDPSANEVAMDIVYSGMCHSDIHQIRAEWPIQSVYPMTPGHEIVGLVTAVGDAVTKFAVGDRVGVGCFVDSCAKCTECKDGNEHYCSGPTIGEINGNVGTYNSVMKGEKARVMNLTHIEGHETHEVTHGGYSQSIVVNADYVMSVPDNLNLADAAPLLCAGITTYSPLVHYGAKKGGKGFKLAVAGYGGLGSMAVKLGLAMGNDVTVISRSQRKQAQVEATGANFVIFDGEISKTYGRHFDLIIDTISADHDLMAYVPLLKCEGTLCLVGLPPSAIPIHPFQIIPRRIKIGGSMIGGIHETQEMLEFCSEHNITSDVTVIAASEVNQAINNIAKNTNPTARYVIDVANTLNENTVVIDEPECLLPENRGVVHPGATVLPASANHSVVDKCCKSVVAKVVSAVVVLGGAIAAAALIRRRQQRA